MAFWYTRLQDSTAALRAYRGPVQDSNTPNLRTKIMADAQTPIMLAYGTADTTVPSDLNVETLYSAYLANGGTHMTIIPVEGGDHTVTKQMLPALRNFMLRRSAFSSAALP